MATVPHHEIHQNQYPYHSDLRDVTEKEEGLAIRFKKAFHHRKKDKDFAVWTPMTGMVDEQLYTCENKAIFNKLQGLQEGEVYVLKAYGSRDSATIEVMDINGNPVTVAQPQGPPQAQEPTGGGVPGLPAAAGGGGNGRMPGLGGPSNAAAQPSAPAPAQPATPLIDQRMVELLVRSDAIIQAASERMGNRTPSELHQKIAVTLFIEEQRGK